MKSDAIKWEKCNGLVPTVVQEIDSGKVLMLAYSSKESLAKALRAGKGIYWSRSRQSLWEKGETSGNTQELILALSDCDRDSLLFMVKQKGNACHLNRKTCFLGRVRK